MSTFPDDPAAAAAARIGDILATAEREVAEIISAAEQRATDQERSRAEALAERAALLDRRREELDARDRAQGERELALSARAHALDVRDAQLAARHAELTEIATELLAGTLATQAQARRLSDLPPLDGPSAAPATGGASAPVPATEPVAPAGVSSWRSARPSTARRREDDEWAGRARSSRRSFGAPSPEDPVADDAPRPSTPAALRIVGPGEEGVARRGEHDTPVPAAGADADAMSEDRAEADPTGRAADGAPAADVATHAAVDADDALVETGGSATEAGAEPDPSTGETHAGTDVAPDPSTDEGRGGTDVEDGTADAAGERRPETVAPAPAGAPAEAAPVAGVPEGLAAHVFDGTTGRTDPELPSAGGGAEPDEAEHDDRTVEIAAAEPAGDLEGPAPGDGPEWRDVLDTDEPAGGERPKWRDVLMPRRAGHDEPDVDGSEPDDDVDEAPADSPDKIDSARLVALSMAAEGRSREDVERIVRDQLGIREHEALLDYVFGISTPSSIVPSWPPRRRRRPS